MGEFVRTGRNGAVATIRLDRPPANALAREVSLELSAAAKEVTADEGVRAVVVWGGERIFAAGADIKAMVDYGPEEVASDVGALEQACRDVESIPAITIAAINGYALGGGCELALSCDFRFAAQDARIGLPEVRLGIIPGSGGTQRLPRVIGLAKARDLVYTGAWTRRRPSRSAWWTASPKGMSTPWPSSMRRSSRRVQRWPTPLPSARWRRSIALEQGLAVEREAFVALFATRDQEEGMRAFLDKREPRFEGR